MNKFVLLDNIVLYSLIGAGCAVVAIIVFFIIFSQINKNKKKKEGNAICEKIVLYLGDKENIKSIEAKGSRLVVSLNNVELMNEVELKNLGVSSILKMSSKITLVIGNISTDVVNYYNS